MTSRGTFHFVFFGRDPFFSRFVGFRKPRKTATPRTVVWLVNVGTPFDEQKNAKGMGSWAFSPPRKCLNACWLRENEENTSSAAECVSTFWVTFQTVQSKVVFSLAQRTNN